MRSAVLEALAFDEPVTDLPRVRTSAEWVAYFRANRERRLSVPWDEPAHFDADELETVIASLRAWQLGESSDAVQLRAMAAQYARDTKDPAFAEAMELFVAEEQRHGAELGRVLDRAGVPRKTWDFGDAVFRVFRHCLSRMESFVTVVLMVEVLALVYYAAVRRATKCPALRAVCAQILRDEVPHIRFQCERLAQMHRRRGRVGRALTGAAQRFLFAGVALAVWIGHRHALRAGGVSFRRFWNRAHARMALARRAADPRAYRWA
jgi:hypothetical protein